MITQIVLADGRRIVKYACDGTAYKDTTYATPCDTTQCVQYGPKELYVGPKEWILSGYNEKTSQFDLSLCPDCVDSWYNDEQDTLENLYDEAVNAINLQPDTDEQQADETIKPFALPPEGGAGYDALQVLLERFQNTSRTYYRGPR